MGSSSKYVEELRQCQLFKIGRKGSKNICKAIKYFWHLILAESLLQSSCGYLWSTAEPTQSTTEQSMVGRGQKGGSRRAEWDWSCRESPCLTQKQLHKASATQLCSAAEVFISWCLLLVVTITVVNFCVGKAQALIPRYTH